MAPVVQNGNNKYNSLLFRKFDDDLLKGSDDRKSVWRTWFKLGLLIT